MDLRSSAALGLNMTRLSSVSELARPHSSREAGTPKSKEHLARPATRPKLEPLIDTGCRVARLAGRRLGKPAGAECREKKDFGN